MDFQCEECFSTDYTEEVGSGEDDTGEFADYQCAECPHVTRIYVKEESV